MKVVGVKCLKKILVLHWSYIFKNKMANRKRALFLGWIVEWFCPINPMLPAESETECIVISWSRLWRSSSRLPIKLQHLSTKSYLARWVVTACGAGCLEVDSRHSHLSFDSFSKTFTLTTPRTLGSLTNRKFRLLESPLNNSRRQETSWMTKTWTRGQKVAETSLQECVG